MKRVITRHVPCPTEEPTGEEKNKAIVWNLKYPKGLSVNNIVYIVGVVVIVIAVLSYFGMR